MTTPLPLKAARLDDDAWRLLAIPFDGPMGRPGTSRYIPGLERGYDMDKQAFAETVDVKADWLNVRPADWHHRYGGDTEIVGKVVDLGNAKGAADEPDEDGWWATFWLSAGAKRRDFIRHMAKAADPDTGEPLLYGSSEAFPRTGRLRTLDGRDVPWQPNTPGLITQWPYMRQAITTSPQNTLSVLRPLKASLDDLYAEGMEPTAAFFDDLERLLGDLTTGPVSNLAGEDTAKAGRVLASRNEARLAEARDVLGNSVSDPREWKRALGLLSDVLDELTRYATPIGEPT